MGVYWSIRTSGRQLMNQNFSTNDFWEEDTFITIFPLYFSFFFFVFFNAIILYNYNSFDPTGFLTDIIWLIAVQEQTRTKCWKGQTFNISVKLKSPINYQMDIYIRYSLFSVFFRRVFTPFWATNVGILYYLY